MRSAGLVNKMPDNISLQLIWFPPHRFDILLCQRYCIFWGFDPEPTGGLTAPQRAPAENSRFACHARFACICRIFTLITLPHFQSPSDATDHMVIKFIHLIGFVTPSPYVTYV